MKLVLVLAALLLTAQNACAQPEGMLKRAGALECEASAGDTSRTEKVTDLKCVLRLRHSDKTYAVSGTLYGSALYVVEGGIRRMTPPAVHMSAPPNWVPVNTLPAKK